MTTMTMTVERTPGPSEEIRPPSNAAVTFLRRTAGRSKGGVADRPPLGPGEVWSIRQYLRDGVATTEQIAEALNLRAEFIAVIAEAR